MRVLQINTLANSGSTGRIAEEIGSVLLANGHESYIAFGRGLPTSKSKLIRIGTQFDNYTHGLKSLFLDRHGFGSAAATNKLVVEIQKIKPDVIGLHNLHGYYLNIEILFNYLKNANIPVIWTLHDSWSYTGHCTFYDSVNCSKWKSCCYACPKKNKYPSSFLFDQSKRNYLDKKFLFSQLEKLHLVTPSKWLANEVSQSFLTSKRLSVIHNGVDLDVFNIYSNSDCLDFKKRFDLDLSKKIILGVANIWDKRKGLDDFLKLRSILSDDYFIVLIGLKTNQIKALPKGIYGIRRTENLQDLSLWYSIADVFVNPTYQDNFPTTNLESLACGTPVITYNTGGSPEAIDEHTGFVVDKGDIDGIVEKLKELKELNYQRISLACRTRAETLYNKETRYLDYLHVFEEMVGDETRRDSI